MNQPSPAIVSQDAVRPLPRLPLLLLCLVYVLAGYLGRDPWKNADMASLGYMLELAHGKTDWLHPELLGLAPELPALLPYWLGAWAIQCAPNWLPADMAARLPFMGLLGLTMAATWYGIYHLARSPQAQPVSFAFGGEAQPVDYARAVADGGLLALLACLGLVQLTHETTPATAQLAFGALCFFGVAVLPYRSHAGLVAAGLGLLGLSLSGAPAIALALGLGATLIHVLDRDGAATAQPQRRNAMLLLSVSLLAALVAWGLDQWHWRIVWPASRWLEWRNILRLWLWFSWPSWPLALWTLWRWRRQRASRHVLLPLSFVLVGAVASVVSGGDRVLLLALPGLAALAAFALPTWSRSFAALVDWFSLLFFSSLAAAGWIIWIASLVGVPPQPAANVARLFPGYVAQFSAPLLGLALAATLAWLALVRWRTRRQRAALWKSLVLPAGGTVLLWFMMTTLGMPLFNYARSYAPLIHQIATEVDTTACVQVHGMTRAQLAALRFHAHLELRPASGQALCPWLIVDTEAQSSLGGAVNLEHWQWVRAVRRPSDDSEDVLLYRRVPDR